MQKMSYQLILSCFYQLRNDLFNYILIEEEVLLEFLFGNICKHTLVIFFFKIDQHINHYLIHSFNDPFIVTIIFREPALLRCSFNQIPCQVPRLS